MASSQPDASHFWFLWSLSDVRTEPIMRLNIGMRPRLSSSPTHFQTCPIKPPNLNVRVKVSRTLASVVTSEWIQRNCQPTWISVLIFLMASPRANRRLNSRRPMKMLFNTFKLCNQGFYGHQHRSRWSTNSSHGAVTLVANKRNLWNRRKSFIYVRCFETQKV